MKTIKLLTSLLAAFLFFLIPVTSYADVEVPNKASGYVTDQASLFSSNQISQLNNELSNTKYHYFVITVSSLQGESIQSYANQIAHTWNVGGNDVLFVIAPKDRQFSIYTETGSEIDNTITSREPGQTTADQYRALEDETFVPYARKNDFVGGILNTAQAIDTMVPQSVIDAQRSAVMANGLKIAFTAIILLALLAFGAFLFFKRRKISENLKNIKKTTAGLINEALSLQEEIKKFFQFAEGKTTQTSEKLLSDVEHALEKLVETKNNLDKLKVPFTRFSNFEATLHQNHNETKSSNSLIEAVTTNFTRIKDIDSRNRSLLNELDKELKSIQTAVENLSQKHGLTLEKIKKNVEAHVEALENAKSLNVLDPVNAQGVVQTLDFENVLEKLTWLEQNIQSYETKYVKRVEDLFKQMESLQKNEDVDFGEEPTIHLTAAKTQIETLKTHFNNGDVEIIKKVFEKIEIEIGKATKIIDFAIKAKKEYSSSITKVENLLKELEKDSTAQIESEKQRLASKFVQSDWNGELSKLPLVANKVAEAKKNFGVIDQSSKKYDELSSKINEVLETLTSAKMIKDDFFSIYGKLVQEQNRLINDLADSRSSYQALISTLNSLKSTVGMNALSDEISNLIAQADNIAKQAPFNSKSLSDVLHEINQKLSQFKFDVDGLKKQKEEAEIKLKKAAANFASKNRKVNSRVSTSSYNSRYNNSYSQAQDLIDAGNFVEALAVMETIDVIMDDMDNDYRRNSYSSGGYNDSDWSSSSSSDWSSSSSSSSSWDSGGSSSWGSDSSSSSWDSGSSSSWDSGGSSDW